jgi:acyl-CoA thioester hydrolase
MLSHISQIRVRYADTDQMRFAYYGKYFEYFEHARGDFLRSLGFPYSTLEEQGIWIPVIEAHAEYKRAARYDDLLIIETRVHEKPTVKFRIEYEVHRDGIPGLIATGHTIHTFLNSGNGKPTRPPSNFVSVFEQALARQ